MYAIYRTIHPPTGIEHCLYCNFTSSVESNLITAGGNFLQVFRFISEPEEENAEQETKSRLQKLEVVAQFHLWGSLTSVAAIKFPGMVRDGLLLAFKDAKTSLIEYDPENHDLVTKSLHYFEDDDIKANCQAPVSVPMLRVDPDMRCAACLIYGNKLAVFIPRREGLDDSWDPARDSTSYLASYVIDLPSVEERLSSHIIDLQFMHGYYEPTLFILCEQTRTWPGRIAVRKDCCSIVAISLNHTDRVHPVIWSASNLPFDCQKALPIPKPIGGVIVFAANSLLYLNQSIPPYGVAVNSIARRTTCFPLSDQEALKITLDSCQACILDYERIALTLKGGEVYVVTLLSDIMRSIKGFHFERAASSVLTSCVCKCDEGHIFLGSRLGNSLLVRYNEKTNVSLPAVKVKKEKEEEPPSKRRKTEAIILFDGTDEFDFELYGTSELELRQTSAQTMVQLLFEVCDSLLNIGPCGWAVVGEPPLLSEEFSTNVDPDLELVSTCGHGKNGAIVILQRSIRPHVVTTFELPGCLDMWTVFDAQKQDEFEHAFLIITKSDCTMVLQTDREIREIDDTGFATNGPTIFAGNMAEHKFVVQVLEHAVLLLRGATSTHRLALEESVVSASLADPFLTMVTTEGHVIVVRLTDDRLHVVAKITDRHVATAALYEDKSGLFVCEMSSDSNTGDSQPAPTETLTIDDEDELLYGDADVKAVSCWTGAPLLKNEKPQREQTGVETSFWLVIVTEAGALELIKLPTIQSAFFCPDFGVARPLVVDEAEEKEAKFTENTARVSEIQLVGLGFHESRPHLLVRFGEDVVVYEAFPFVHHVSGRLQLRFKRVELALMTRERRQARARRLKAEADKVVPRLQLPTRWFRPFNAIQGCAGVFIAGLSPHWLIMGTRGALRCHPMDIDGMVTSFAPFNNVNCQNGFLYFNLQGDLRIAVLPSHLVYDAHWPTRKVPLRATPHFLTYHSENKLYVIINSVMELSNRVVKIEEEEKKDESLARDENFLLPQQQKFSLQLYSPASWEAVPNVKLDLLDWEHATCLKPVSLKFQGYASGMKTYMALGTVHCCGEGVNTRGRIIIFDIIEVVPEPGQPLTKNKIKVLYEKEQKGPVTALEHVRGLLVSAIGQKIFLWQYRDDDLIGLAFIDTSIYITEMVSLKNFILISDVQKSVSLLRFQEQLKVLSYICRDIKPMEVYGTEYMVDNTTLSFMATDRDQNLTMFVYQPEAPESAGGTRLVRRSAFYLGTHVNRIQRVRCKLLDPSMSEKKPNMNFEKRHVNILPTLDGGIGCVLPIMEKTFRRLFMLQNLLTLLLPHNAGLNPQAFRQFETRTKMLLNLQKCILDGDLLLKFLELSYKDRNEYARRIGTSPEQIIDDLTEVIRVTNVF